jgi:hypothetical protein
MQELNTVQVGSEDVDHIDYYYNAYATMGPWLPLYEAF